MRDPGLVSSNEPFKRLLCQGMVLADTFYRETSNGGQEWFSPTDIDTKKDSKGQLIEATLRSDGKPVYHKGMIKMSKSKNNGVDPQAIIDQHGADTVRLFMMFAAPPEQSLEWSDSGVDGANKFLKRFWKLATTHISKGEAPALDIAGLNKHQKTLRRKLHETIQKVGDDFGRRYTFNTAIAAIMELCNAISKLDNNTENQATIHEAIEATVLMLAPIVPHVCHELWQALGHTDDVLTAPWPAVDQDALVKDSIQMVIQVNGKVRAKMDVSLTESKEDIEARALTNENVIKFVGDKTIKKVIVVPGKLVSIVAK